MKSRQYIFSKKQEECINNYSSLNKYHHENNEEQVKKRLTEKEKLLKNEKEFIEKCNTLTDACFSDDFSDIVPEKKEDKKHIDITNLKTMSRPELFNMAKELPIKKEKLGRHLTKDELSKLIIKTNKKNNKIYDYNIR